MLLKYCVAARLIPSLAWYYAVEAQRNITRSSCTEAVFVSHNGQLAIYALSSLMPVILLQRSSRTMGLVSNKEAG
jgi:hypothetical protein